VGMCVCIDKCVRVCVCACACRASAHGNDEEETMPPNHINPAKLCILI